MVSSEKSGKQIITCAAYSSGRRVADVELNDVHKVLKEENQFVWIALHEPSEETLMRVQQEFGLHDLAVEDAHSAHQRPKIELYGDSLFIVCGLLRSTRNMKSSLAKRIFLLVIISL